ncbi:Panacea domain-containing protein [Mesorhizobium sp. M0589]|uniref:Panacea domain-containing protein n=1 Tax=Mesorhizobium sp. M0589 TaxID=2956965 RepID=UPI00333A9E93
MIRFKFAPRKAYAALHWMVCQTKDIDLHTALKACYFADKDHLNAYHRPIFGATYKAMKFGPVPLEIYEMAKGEALWLAEIHTDHLPWKLQGYRLRLEGNYEVDLSELSQSDLEFLGGALGRSLKMSFSERTAATHGPDWQKANLGLMRYEDMLDETEDKPAIIEYLTENARFMRL